MSTYPDKFNIDIDCLNQIMTLQEWLQEMRKTNARVYIEIKLKGFINDHFQSCTNADCVCSHIEEIYDPGSDKYLKLKTFGLDRDSIRAEGDEDRGDS